MPPATDWDRYYLKPYRAATVSRAIVGRRLRRLIARHMEGARHFTITELGGANSCFYDMLARDFAPATYTAVDTNALGLDHLRQRAPAAHVMHRDILCLEGAAVPGSDLVFSIGLIEHFSPADTARAVAAHFRFVRPGGLVVISFPTPTWLYRLARSISEALGLWIFHDERPLRLAEIAPLLRSLGTLRDDFIIWPIGFTQHMIALRAHTVPQETP
jgi:SAM-dependent methyltransferase